MAGCASTQTQTQNKENLLIAAGFKVITPHTAAQQQRLQALPPDKVTLVPKNGKTYYVFPDTANNQAYVGGPNNIKLISNFACKLNWPTKILRPQR